MLTALLNGTEAPAVAEYFSHNSGASANKSVAYFTIFLPRYEASGGISPDRNFTPSTGKVEAVDDAGDTEEGDTDEHDIIDEEDGGDDAGNGDTSIEEEDADATPPRANLASTFASAWSLSVPLFEVGMRPIDFLVPLFLLALLEWSRVLISFVIISSIPIAAADGILRHQVSC